jgi:hypothetical protein
MEVDTKLNPHVCFGMMPVMLEAPGLIRVNER